MKKISLLLTFILIMTHAGWAQWVSIPDTAFGAWLYSSGYSTCLSGSSATGWQMDTTCSAVVQAAKMDLTQSHNILSVGGVQYFRSLDTLICAAYPPVAISALPSQLRYLRSYCTNLPALPASLAYLDCSNSQLHSLPALPASLTYLDCSNITSLQSLPGLPLSLTTLNCSQDSLTSLPALPTGLTTLDCSQNYIGVLPSLPSSIGYLVYGSQQLAQIYITGPANIPATVTYLDCSLSMSLPSLPQGLTTLFCDDIGSGVNLSSLPPNLTYLSCDNSGMSYLPPLPASLTYLRCGGNNITSLPSLPDSLTFLNCGYNPLSLLPTLPQTLVFLWCSYDSLISLPSLPGNLKSLYCDHNKISYLPPLPLGLAGLDCSYDSLTSLPALPPGLLNLDCYYNRISSIPSLPSSLGSADFSHNLTLACLPILPSNLTWLYIDATAISCVPNRISLSVHGILNPDSLPICGISSGCPLDWNISGNVHKDTSGSCTSDSIYPGHGLSHIKICLSRNGRVEQQVYSTSFGNYSFVTDSLASYEVYADTTGLPLSHACPSTYIDTAALTTADSLLIVNFGMECAGIDAGVASICGRFVSGQMRQLSIRAGDVYGYGCTGTGPAVMRTRIDGLAHYVSTAPGALTPSSISGNVLTYNISNVSLVNPSTSFNIMVQTDTVTAPGYTVCVTSALHTLTPDYILSDDSVTMCFPLEDSYDPNEKTVYPDTVTSRGGWLTYTVDFQNTGTDTAYNIVVRDTLSSAFQPESFQYLASSAAQPFIQVFGNVIVFTFSNINLVDSGTNQPGSQAWVQFRLRTVSTLRQGTAIPNQAAIFFDFNPPVYTNTSVVQTALACADIFDTIYSSICQGTSYSFAGHSITQAGTYSDTMIASTGCDSIVTLRLSVLPAPVVTWVQTRTWICSNGGFVPPLTGGLPAGGQYQGPFVMHDSITPALSSSQLDTTFAITYSYTDSEGCTGAVSVQFHANICEGIIAPLAGHLRLYPDPNGGIFTLETAGLQGAMYEVYDAIGRSVAHAGIRSDMQQVSLPGAAPGIYMLVAAGVAIRFTVVGE